MRIKSGQVWRSSSTPTGKEAFYLVLNEHPEAYAVETLDELGKIELWTLAAFTEFCILFQDI